MENRTAAIVAVSTCGVGFLAAWLIFRSDGTRRIDDASLSQESRGLQRDAQEKVVHQEPAILDRPDSLVPALTERPAPSEPAPVSSVSVPTKPTTIDPSDPRTLPETTIAEMKTKREAIDNHLVELKAPFIEQQYRAGLFEHVSDTGGWSGRKTEQERNEVYSVIMGADIGTNLVVLPRWQFPDLYAFKDETIRLDKLIDEAQRKAAEEKKPQ